MNLFRVGLFIEYYTTEFLSKWLFCKWFHKKNLCYPRCDLPDPEYKKHWHCDRCHPCTEFLDKISGKQGFFSLKIR